MTPRHRQKPRTGTRIDAAHPLVRGLAAFYLLNEQGGSMAIDSKMGPVGTLVNPTTRRSGRSGLCVQFDKASDRYIDCGSNPALSITENLTVTCSYTLATSPSSGAYQLFSRDHNTLGRAYTTDVQTTFGARFYINGGGTAGSGGTTNEVREARGPVAGDSRTITVTYQKSPGVLALYLNGKLVTSVTATTAGIPTCTANTLIGRRSYSGFTEPFDGQIHFAGAWSRVLTPHEILWLNVEPYAFMQPPVPARRYFIPNVAAGSSFQPAWAAAASHVIGVSNA